MNTSLLTDPFKFQKACWPEITFYDKQAEIVESVIYNEETVVVAGNDLGKDFISGFICVWFQMSRMPTRIISTSASHNQLKGVLWGEINRFIQSSRIPLPIETTANPAAYTINSRGVRDPRTYHFGIVAKAPETFQGHHLAETEMTPTERLAWESHLKAFAGHHLPGSTKLPRTLAIIDEASGVSQEHYDMIDTWAHRKLIIGNPLECVMFKRLVKGGDILINS